MKRALGVAAILLGVAAMSVGSAGFAAAQGSGGHGHNGGVSPGNNGTIKIENWALVPTGKVDHDNDPHVSCQFELKFFGFDNTVNTAQVFFWAQAPSGHGQAVSPTRGPSAFTFQGFGPGGTLDTYKTYELDVTGLKANPNQGYHIKVEVEVGEPNLTPPLPLGADDKYKVFWYEPCSVPTTTTSTTVKHHETTTTSTTLTPTSSSLPEKETTTTVKHHETTTTTIPPSSSSVPEEGSTTTSTTRPPHAVTTTSTTSTVPPAIAVSPGQPQSRSGLAFTSGPTPSGAGTDLGFFSPAGSSHLPWLLLIVGGILLSGAGTFSLTGSPVRKWISRA